MKQILFTIMIALLFTGCSTESDESKTETPPPTENKYDVTVDLKMPGTLASNIPNKEFKTIKIKGNLNGTDIKFIRGIIESLSVIDLEDASIIEGGESYYKITHKTKNNVIGRFMFTELEGSFEIILPKTIKSIEDEAFSECNGLTNVTIGNNTTSIGDRIFFRCQNLKSISLPDNIKNIGMNSFSVCLSLDKVSFPRYVKVIESYAFSHCEKLKAIDLPDNLEKIESNAFYNCSLLNEIKIPNSVNEIESSAFMDCSNLEKVYIPQNIYKLEIQTFRDCNKLKYVHCYAKTPPIIGSETNNQQSFPTFPYNIERLYIPKGTLQLYKNSSWSKFFKNITEE